jgi:hypothetical protein
MKSGGPNGGTTVINISDLLIGRPFRKIPLTDRFLKAVGYKT